MSDREDLSALINSGTSHHQEGRHDEAIMAFDKAVALDDSAAEAFYGRGLVHQHRDDSKAALADFNRVIELDPLHIDALFARSISQRRLGDFEKAATDFDLAVQTLWSQRKIGAEQSPSPANGDVPAPAAERSSLEQAA